MNEMGPASQRRGQNLSAKLGGEQQPLWHAVVGGHGMERCSLWQTREHVFSVGGMAAPQLWTLITTQECGNSMLLGLVVLKKSWKLGFYVKSPHF